MTLPNTTIDGAQIDLRQQVNYWRTQHSRAIQREAALKDKVRQLEATVREQAAQLRVQAEQLDAFKARVRLLERQLFGRKSEQSLDTPSAEAIRQPEQPSDSSESQGRSRGKQPGAKGYGRKPREALPTQDVIHALPEAAQCCPACGLPFVEFPGFEESEEIHWEVHILRRVHHRRRYRPTCACRALPGILAAPGPAKLIPKGMFSTGFWGHLLVEKYLFQRPLYRVRQMLDLHGLSVSQGTLTGGLKRIFQLLQPLYAAILEQSRSASHWQMDETRWRVFEDLEGKGSHKWWLWVVITKQTCCYLLEPSRSAKVIQNHLGEQATGILNADRFSAYKALGEAIQIAFCWSHIRRDFVRIQDGYPVLESWAQTWIERIHELFRLNAQRLQEKPGSPAFFAHDQALREAAAHLRETRDEQVADPSLQPVARKALESLKNHWEGATLFIDHPHIPMDNNESERRLRNPVLGRKNYAGSGAIWSGTLTAALFTFFQTCLINGIDPQQALLAYLDACAQNGGNPPENLSDFLPWNLSEERRCAWAYPRKPP